VATGDMGVSRDGQHKASFAQGVELHAKYTLLAEGARGSLSKQVINRGWFKTCHFQVTPEIDRAVMVKGFLVLGVTLI